MTSLRITVIGGTGFVGRKLVKRLADAGHTVTVLSRNLGSHAERLLPPNVALREINIYDLPALKRTFTNQHAIINLTGILNERGDNGRGFQRIYVDLTKNIIAACQSTGVKRLLQMSALNAGRGKSYYLKARGEAEALVKASGLDWTIFEPSVIFGVGDGLFTRFSRLLKNIPVLPLARAEAKFAPVYVGDVVEAYFRCLDDRSSIGEIYELYGPQTLTLKEIVQMTAKQRGWYRLIVPLPDTLGRLQALLCDFIPGKPFSSDNFRSLMIGSVGGVDGLHRLGITPTAIAATLPDILGNDDDKQTRFVRYRAMR